MAQLSEKTIGKLADTLVEDVIDYILEDERLNEFYLEVIGDAVCEKLGKKNEDGTCSFDSGISSESASILSINLNAGISSPM